MCWKLWLAEWGATFWKKVWDFVGQNTPREPLYAHGVKVPEYLKQLGRWKPSSDEGYQRNARANVLRSHRMIAEFVRSNAGREDVFDEESVFAKIGSAMAEEGLEDQEIEAQVERLRYFAGPGDWRDATIRVEWSDQGPMTLTFKKKVVEDGDKEDEEMMDAWGEDDDDEIDGIEGQNTAQLRGQFVCSIVGRSKTRTLHKVGECHRLPSVHYHEFEVLGFDVPKAESYHKICSVCFPDKDRLISLEEDESSSEEVSSYDSSESGEEATWKRRGWKSHLRVQELVDRVQNRVACEGVVQAVHVTVEPLESKFVACFWDRRRNRISAVGKWHHKGSRP